MTWRFMLQTGHLGPRIWIKVVHYNRYFVVTVIVTTEFNYITKALSYLKTNNWAFFYRSVYYYAYSVELLCFGIMKKICRVKRFQKNFAIKSINIYDTNFFCCCCTDVYWICSAPSLVVDTLVPLPREQTLTRV